MGAYQQGVPDASFTLGKVITSGNDLVIEGTYSGTHTGPLVGPQGEIPATGKTVNVPFVSMFEIGGDTIASHRAYWDNAGFMAQLGLTPPPAS